MFQGIREIKAAPSRTALITITVAMITLMVTFLSSLAAGLSYQSVSALQDRVNDDSALVLEDTGTVSLSASKLTEDQMHTLVDTMGGEQLTMARDKVGGDPIAILSSPSVAAGHVGVPAEITDKLKSQNLQLSGASDKSFRVEPAPDELYFDHLPVVFISDEDAGLFAHASTGAIVSKESLDKNGGAPEGTTVLEGKDRWNASASYAGEQLSLNMMINLLYVISALVLGAFFMVWTMQRLRGVAISSALGASRRVLIADSLGQALVVLLVGITVGMGITTGAGLLMGDALPIVLDTSTLLQPALFLLIAGIVGSAISLRPVTKVSPRSAMAAA